MTLSKANIITYLLGKGLLTFEQAVKGDIVVIDVTRRNKNLKVVLPGNEGGYFVKQIQAQNPTSVANLRREATCYWLASSHSDFRSMKPLVPKYLYYDTDKNVLITAILPHSMNLTQYYSQNGRFDGTVAKELGKTLGTYHSKINLDPERQQIKDIFPGAVSWILGYHHNGHQLFGNLAGGNRDIIKIINQFPDFVNKLDQLRKDWIPNGLIHGDMKWDNIIIAPRKNGINLQIADWELSDIGDTRWDVAAVLQSYLTFWVIHMPQDAKMPTTQQVDNAKYSLETMQPALQRFWITYTDTLGVSGKEKYRLLEQSVKYAAARMIQTAYEYLQNSEQITTYGVNILQLSLNMLSRPKEAINQLLGIKV